MKRSREAIGQMSLDISSLENPSLKIPDMPEVRPIIDIKGTTTKIIEDQEARVIKKSEAEKTKERVKPDVAFINNANLTIVRDTTHSKDSDEDLIDKLVVFMGWTPISLEPAEERKNNYSVRLNIGVIAWKSQVIDNYCVPDGYDSYQVLGVFRPFKEETDEDKKDDKYNNDIKNKCFRKFVTIQKSDCDHPENLNIGSYFFAKPEDEIVVKKSNFGKTSYWTKKK